MTQEQHLNNYLKGALAGKLIDSAGREVDCQDGPFLPEDGAVLQLEAPLSLSTDAKSDLYVHVRNVLQRTGRGTLLLKGEETSRGASYEFEAPIRFQTDADCCCIAFSWKAPSYPTRVTWSASVQCELQTGESQTECSAATLVTETIA